jgi:ABC-type microcin C transport system permease subunit YejE
MFAGTIPDNSTALANTNPTMVVTDYEGGVYFPIVCVYESETVYPKIFLANSTEDGIDRLMSNEDDVLKSVTGERVKEFGFMLWTNFRTGTDVADEAERVE